MTGRLILFEGAYATLDLFTGELHRELIKIGYECFVYDIREEEKSLRQLALFLAKPVDAALGYNNLGFNMERAAGCIIWDELNIPFINILMDHPFRYHRAMSNPPKMSIVLCPDRNHVNYIRRFYPQIWKADFLPHGGVEYKTNKPLSRLKDRTIDVLYAGGLSRGMAKDLIPDLEKYTRFDGVDLMKNVLEELIKNPWKTTEEAIEEYLTAGNVAVTDMELREYINDLRFIDSYAVSYYREGAIRQLVENGIKVHVYGGGWDCCDLVNNKNFVLCKIVPAGEIPGIMRDSKIVLNTMTWFKDGTHDRVFNAMLAGAVAVTDTSIYMKEHFTDGKGIRMFELKEEWYLPYMIRELLSDEEKAQQIADDGYQTARKDHTFVQQAQFIYQNILIKLDEKQ